MPALGAIVESMGAGARALVLAEVADRHEEQRWRSSAQVEIAWLYRDGAARGNSDAPLATLRSLELPEGHPCAWLAGEAGTVRSLRRHLLGERGLAREDICFTGYWRRGKSEDAVGLEAQDCGEDPLAEWD